jgi:hypothetical protein
LGTCAKASLFSKSKSERDATAKKWYFLNILFDKYKTKLYKTLFWQKSLCFLKE